MIFDGRFKWVKYAGGEQMLFRRDADPQEIDDLADTDVGRQIARRLDGELTTRMLRSMQAAHSERVVAHEP
ncbi:MAG TPA: sulfatase, partial [Candidatus Latescibacteria bacterium]|nr:sulfatase [Candidatus Latescibacterota bacterium]